MSDNKLCQQTRYANARAAGCCPKCPAGCPARPGKALCEKHAAADGKRIQRYRTHPPRERVVSVFDETPPEVPGRVLAIPGGITITWPTTRACGLCKGSGTHGARSAGSAVTCMRCKGTGRGGEAR